MENKFDEFSRACNDGDIKKINEFFDMVHNDNDDNYRNFFVMNQMNKAAKTGNIHVVECLWNRNVRPNGTICVTTPLMKASINGHVDIVDFLLKNNIDVNITGTDGWTALMNACAFGQIDVVDRLLNIEGCNINYQDTSGHSAIFLATEWGHHEIVNRLIVYGANYYAHDKMNRNLLHFAVISQQEEMVNCILLLGLEIEQKDIEGDTPLSMANRLKLSNIVSMLSKSEERKNYHIK